MAAFYLRNEARKSTGDKGKHSGAMTPFKFEVTAANGWRIGYGVSGFLIAEGSGFSRSAGRAMFRDLEDEWHKRPKKGLSPQWP